MGHLFRPVHGYRLEVRGTARRTTRRPIEWIAGQVVESLEPIALLSTASPTIGFGGMNPDSPTTPVTVSQTITIGDPSNPNLPTNYTGQAFAPALSLFDPSLGTLQSVQISSDVVYDSKITVTNLSQVAAATGIQASISGNYQIDGLGPTLTISGAPKKSGAGADLPGNGTTPGMPPSDTIDLAAEDKQDPVLTSAQDLAFFTAGTGQTTITPTMTATGSGTAGATDGNGTVTQSTFASASLTIIYTYIPEARRLIEPRTSSIVQTPTPTPPSPSPSSAPQPVSAITIAPPMATSPENRAPALPSGVTRFGVHHQPTKLVVRFSGVVNPVQAANANNYLITARGPAGRFGAPDNLHYKISSAIYDATPNAVLLTSARRLNFRDHFELTIDLAPISPGGNGTETTMLFGGNQILGGFVGNHGHGTALLPLRKHHNQIGIRATPVNVLGALAAPDGPRRRYTGTGTN